MIEDGWNGFKWVICDGNGHRVFVCIILELGAFGVCIAVTLADGGPSGYDAMEIVFQQILLLSVYDSLKSGHWISFASGLRYAAGIAHFFINKLNVPFRIALTIIVINHLIIKYDAARTTWTKGERQQSLADRTNVNAGVLNVGIQYHRHIHSPSGPNKYKIYSFFTSDKKEPQPRHERMEKTLLLQLRWKRRKKFCDAIGGA